MEEHKLGVVAAFGFCVIFALCCCTKAQGFLISGTQRAALLDLRSSLGIRSRYWPIKSDPCTFWTGIQCRNGRVVGINVSGFKRTRRGRLNPSFSVDSMANFTFLENFNASGFLLPGPIPDWFGFRLGSLEVLDLSSCKVVGTIPASLGNLTRLAVLGLSDNGLTGGIPAALCQLFKLSVLDLSQNWLTGSIPTCFALLSNVSRFNLSSNYLSGSIPSGLGNISAMRVLDLSDNSFLGPIPDEFGNVSQLEEINLGKNSFSGPLPEKFKDLRNLRRMEVGDNALEGSLMDGLFVNLVNLEVADFNGNKFEGALPDALWSLPTLRVLDVSHNNLTGDLASFRSMGVASGAVFNLSYNMFYGTLGFPFGHFKSVDLSSNYVLGKVPDGILSDVNLNRNCLQDELNQRSLDDCRLFYTKRRLRFDGFNPSAASKKSDRWKYTLIGVLCGLAFIVVVVVTIAIIVRKCSNTSNQRASANVGPVPARVNPSHPKDPASSVEDSFKYEQLLRSTDGFSEENLIKHGHSGDLFRGLLEGGVPVIIKRVKMHSTNNESYLAELEFFNKYSHTRLVPLLGHCLANENEKFLVYKYMPNGDLASSLYKVTDIESDDSVQSLDWITRLKIAVGAAEGLSYLHHECNPPVVHRDVQASSILLDDKFEVRLGSFSEVRVQEGDSHHKVLTRLLRKPQSSEPGPSGSSSTCSHDIYCFGKVLLELITGKLGISKSEDASTRELLEHTLSYISIYDKEMVTKIIDPSLILDEDLLEELWAMAIVARSCLNPKPSKRPPMKYILKALENPLKVVREESYSSGRLRTTSSRRSWSAALFGSWRQSSLDNNTAAVGQSSFGISGQRQPGRVGSTGSGIIEHSSSNKRLSNEIFPEPLEVQDTERQDDD